MFAFALLLSLCAPSTAFGFGFITKWRIRDTPPIAAHGRAVYLAAANASSQWIQRYTTRGSLGTQWRVPEYHGGDMRVTALATDGAGRVFALASYDHRTKNTVLEYTDRGRLIDSWRVGAGPTARGIAVDATGVVYVAVTADNRIERYDQSGRLLTKLEVPGPLQVATGGGNVYVSGRTGVSVYREDGSLVKVWAAAGEPSGENGGLESPYGIAVDRAGRVLVADGGRHARDVKAYTPEGAYLGQIGGPGRGNGHFRFAPGYVAVDARGDVYVVSLRTVQKFGEPSSAFGLGGARLNRRSGTARLTVNVPGVGKLNVEGRGIRRTRRRASVAGDVMLSIVPNRAVKKRLQRTGRATVTISVTYTPTTVGNAQPATRSRRLSLVKLAALGGF